MKKDPVAVVDQFDQVPIKSISISAITIAELLYGLQKSSRHQDTQDALYEFLILFDILSFDISAAGEYGRIRAVLEKRGTPIGHMDMLIAAQARYHGLVLVSNNEREFKRVEGLHVVNWVTP
jgi:tRNA(fMet)-specific endonuclease VapC